MDAIAHWIGGTISGYWTLALASAGLVVLAALWPRHFPGWAYALALAACLAAFRWPGIISNSPVNPDESQLLAGAITLRANPIFWKYVDGVTAGPLAIYPLAAWGGLGLPLDFTGARWFELLMEWLCVVGAWRWLREEFRESTARTVVLPLAAFYALTSFWDFIHYSTEQVAAALLALGAAWLWRGVKRGTPFAVAGGMALLGAVPWAKMQGGPIALVIALLGGGFLAHRWWRAPQRARLFAAWFAGGWCATTAVAALLTFAGLWGDWWNTFLLQAVHYNQGGAVRPGEVLERFFAFGDGGQGFNAFVLPLALLAALAGASAVFRRPAHFPILTLAIATAAAALYVVCAPGRYFLHYLHLFVVPVTVLGGAAIGTFLDAGPEDQAGRAPRWLPPILVAGLLLATLVPQAIARAVRLNPYIPPAPDARQLVRSPAARAILALAAPGDAMAIWGWSPHLWVETGLKQGTRDGNTELQISTTPLQAFYRARFLRDLQERRPRFFVDAIGPGAFAFEVRESFNHERVMPELGAYVAAHYRFVADVGGCRLYERNGPPGR